jgi:hypothetical protein
MRASAWAATLVGLLASQSASGAILRIDFAGSVSTIQGSTMSQADAEAALGGSIHIGTLFSGGRRMSVLVTRTKHRHVHAGRACLAR